MFRKSVDAEVVAALALQWNCPLDEVQTLYEQQMNRLREGARITDYLALFASRRTADILAARTRKPDYPPVPTAVVSPTNVAVV
jgi:hypothetical protein